MSWTELLDTTLDRSIVLGYGAPGLRIRSRLPTWPTDPPHMHDKTVLITGAASGIGLAAATGYARLGARVLALARHPERASDAVEAVRYRVGPTAMIEPIACDIADRADLRRCIAELLKTEDRLDVLVNNAGVMPATRTFTVQGVELTFATHVLAPWMLTDGLTPLLAAATPSRVINVSSGGQYAQPIPDDPQSATGAYRSKVVYAQTKRALVAITEYWAARLANRDIHVHAMHPGWVDTPGVRRWMPIFRVLTRPVIRTPEQGADTIIWLGAARESADTTGLFWHDRHPRPTTYRIGPPRDPEPTRQRLYARITELAAQ